MAAYAMTTKRNLAGLGSFVVIGFFKKEEAGSERGPEPDRHPCLRKPAARTPGVT
jgi:hypothetical protein